TRITIANVLQRGFKEIIPFLFVPIRFGMLSAEFSKKKFKLLMDRNDVKPADLCGQSTQIHGVHFDVIVLRQLPNVSTWRGGRARTVNERTDRQFCAFASRINFAEAPLEVTVGSKSKGCEHKSVGRGCVTVADVGISNKLIAFVSSRASSAGSRICFLCQDL